MLPFRELPVVFAATENASTRVPIPTLADVMVIHELSGIASQAHRSSANRLKLDVPPAAEKDWYEGVIVYKQSAAAELSCTTVNVCPPTLMTPVRGLEAGLSRTANTISSPPAPEFAANVIQSTFAAATHPQSLVVAKLSDPSVPAIGKSLLVGDTRYMHGGGGGESVRRLIVPFCPTT